MDILNGMRAMYLMARGWRQLNRRNYPSAINLLEQAAAIDPDETPLLWLLLGHARLGAKDVKAATVAYFRYYDIQRKTNPCEWSKWEQSRFKEGLEKLADCLAWEGRKEDLARLTREIDQMRRASTASG